MAATYVPTAYYHPTIVRPSPGDWATAASVNNAALMFLADDSEFLKTELDKFWISNLGSINVPSGGFVQAAALYASFASITGNLKSTDLEVVNNGSVGNDLTVGNDQMVNRNLSVSQDATVGQDMTVARDLRVLQSLSINQNLTVGTIGGNLLLGAGAQIQSADPAIDLAAHVNVLGNLDVTGQGRVPIRYLEGPDADFSVNGSDYNLLFANYLSVARTWTVTNTGARFGDWFFAANQTGTSAHLFIAVSSGYSVDLAANEVALMVYMSPGWRYIKKWS